MRSICNEVDLEHKKFGKSRIVQSSIFEVI